MENMIDIPGGAHKAIDVTVIGDALIDYQYWVDRMPPVGGDEMISMSGKSTGGSASNTALALGMLNVKTAFCGRVGMDENGRWIEEKMQSAGIDTSCIQYGESTGYVLSIIDKNSERTMLSYRGASAIPLEYTPSLRQVLQNTKILLLSGYCLMNAGQAALSLEAAKETKLAGGLVALDPSPVIGQIGPEILAEMLNAADIILPNKTELQTITNVRDIPASIKTLQLKVPCIALKMGSEGSLAAIREGFTSPFGASYSENGIYREPAQKVTAIDTTGAGDAFNAGFLAEMLKNADPQAWLQEGNELASKIVGKKGASF